jgi:hypothetical protein
MDNKKCAHPSCSCQAPEGQSYCSKACESAKSMTEIACQCQHPECQGTGLRPT